MQVVASSFILEGFVLELVEHLHSDALKYLVYFECTCVDAIYVIFAVFGLINETNVEEFQCIFIFSPASLVSVGFHNLISLTNELATNHYFLFVSHGTFYSIF